MSAAYVLVDPRIPPGPLQSALGSLLTPLTAFDDLFMQKKDGAQKENNVSAENEKRVNRPELVRKEEPEKDHQKQLEELKESLAQIAAARGESGDRQVHKQQTRKLSFNSSNCF